MKSFVSMLLAMGLVTAGGIASAENSQPYEGSTYTLTQGEQWRGVRIGSDSPRTLDTVCENDQCYQFNTLQSLSVEMKRKYGVSTPTFEALASIEGTVRQGNKLILPADLGYEVYMLEYWRRYENDGPGGMF
ncbi:MAG: hypothetical protein OQK12_09000 [Motiliproteus sp.]|nr:hypothetical protein [Motiliproteus sp.]MCW9053602.1 hypothetical protein [Motiliproteus sp.]